MVADELQLRGRRAQAGEEQRFEDLWSFLDEDRERLRGSESQLRFIQLGSGSNNI